METDYDLFDRTGARMATMQHPDSERAVGFGSRSGYVSVRDDDGIVRLRRHPWPFRCYSARSAVTGFTLEARQAGIADATIATATSMIAATA